MTLGSLFAGAGGFDMGFHAAGFRCLWQVEIDPTARDVLARHWPDVERHEDVRGVGRKNLAPVDVVCGGFPCQDISNAGKRKGLAGERSGLFYELLRVTDELRPRFLVWENVAGLWSSDGGRDIRRVCSALAERGYFGCCRTLDGRHFGVPQRRRRVFGVFARGHSGAGRAAEILALAEGVRGHPPAGGETREGIAPAVTPGARRGRPNRGSELLTVGTLTPGAHPGGFNGQDAYSGLYAFGGNNTAGRLRPAAGLNGRSTCRQDFETETFIVKSAHSHDKQNHAKPSSVARSLDTTGGFAANQGGTVVCSTGQGVTHALTGEGHDASEDGTGRGTPIIAFSSKDHGADAGDLAPTLRAGVHRDSHANAGVPPAIAFAENSRDELRTSPIAPALQQPGGRPGHGYSAAMVAGSVRRLTPLECERLMGWPDDWTRWRADGREIADGPRYRLCGNGVIGTVSEWIARRLMAMEAG